MEKNLEVDVRPVSVDRLLQWSEEQLVQRVLRTDILKTEYAALVETAREELERLRAILSSLTEMHAQSELALRICRDDVVRVKCSVCEGTGMKTTDVTSGRITIPSAFETIRMRSDAAEVELIPDDQKCTQCQGQKWLLMERFKG